MIRRRIIEPEPSGALIRRRIGEAGYSGELIRQRIGKVGCSGAAIRRRIGEVARPSSLPRRRIGKERGFPKPRACPDSSGQRRLPLTWKRGLGKPRSDLSSRRGAEEVTK